jgi:outer membrane protein
MSAGNTRHSWTMVQVSRDVAHGDWLDSSPAAVSPAEKVKEFSHSMKRKLVVLLVALMAIAAYAQTATPGGGAPPQPTNAPAPTKIGIINIQAAIVTSNEGQRDFSSLSQKFAPKEAELKQMSTELDDLKKQLETQRDKLNEDAQGNLARNIKAKETALQRAFQDAQEEFQGQQSELAQRIGQKMMQTLDKYARDNGFAVILDVSNPQTPVLWAVPTVNVTEQVVVQYNTDSGVPAPAAGAPAAPSSARPAGAGNPPATRPAGPATPGTTRPAPQQQRPPR